MKCQMLDLRVTIPKGESKDSKESSGEYACQGAQNGQNWPSPHRHIFSFQKIYLTSRRATFNSVGNHR